MKFYTPQEVADILRMKRNSVYAMITRGKLKAIKLNGKKTLIAEEELQKLVGIK